MRRVEHTQPAGVARQTLGGYATRVLNGRVFPGGASTLALSAILSCSAGTRSESGALAPIQSTSSQVSRPPQAQPRANERGAVLDSKTVEEEVARILEGVALARNLEVTSRVKVDVADKKAIRAYVVKNMNEHTTPQEMELQSRIFHSLGVLPADVSLEDALLELLEQSVLGFYDPPTKTLYIGNFVPKFMLSRVVGHEIAHGLQDMHFDLDKRMKPKLHRSDEDAAMRFVWEGGAEAAYFAWVGAEQGLSAMSDEVLAALGNQTLEMAGQMGPYSVLTRNLQMPYTDGAATIVRLVQEKGWKAVDALYSDEPMSTEQMLHVDKLKSREAPIEVSVDPAALEGVLGLKSTWHDQLGEASLLSMVAEVEPPRIARKAADGWGGDAMLAFDEKGREAPVVVAAIAWDSRADAVDFETSFSSYLRSEVKTGTFIGRRRDVVVFATQLPPSVDRGKFKSAVWAAVTVSKAPKKGSR